MSKHIVHILGPDDVIEFDSEFEALEAANNANIAIMISLSEKSEEQKRYFPKAFAYATTIEKLEYFSNKLSGALND